MRETKFGCLVKIGTKSFVKFVLVLLSSYLPYVHTSNGLGSPLLTSAS